MLSGPRRSQSIPDRDIRHVETSYILLQMNPSGSLLWVHVDSPPETTQDGRVKRAAVSRIAILCCGAIHVGVRGQTNRGSPRQRAIVEQCQDFQAKQAASGLEALEDVAADAQELFFDDKLDHSDPANTKTWKHRYFLNDKYYGGPNSPVFLFIEGESPADPVWVSADRVYMVQLAKKHKALIVSIEHRFYGKSQPLPDWSLESFKFLTMKQVVDDAAYFQDHIRATRNVTKASKWVAFGGSYPGQLTAYTKLLHPDRFAGAVASSATIELKPAYPA
ncbi:hypothetical protein As57867_009242, partial [Aphanomyces stellatus]